MSAVMPTMKIIGTVTTYTGSDHPYLRGHRVVIIAIHKGVLVSPDDYSILRDDLEIAAAGGVDDEVDLVEIAPVHADGRASWVTSDAKVIDLEMFRAR